MFLFVGGDMYISWIWWDLLFLGFPNYYFNKIKETYLNSLYDWFNFISFCDKNYIFIEIKFLNFMCLACWLYFITIYPHYFNTTQLIEDLIYHAQINKLRYPGSLGQHTLYIDVDMPYFDEIDE
jgi:hypothetical protein